jgi:hypothetical protein
MTMDSERRSPSANQPHSSVDYIVKPGREEEFIQCWKRLAEWMLDHPLGVRSMVLLRDHEDPARFRSMLRWQTIEFAGERRLYDEGQALYDECSALCDSVESHYYLSAAHLYA